MAKKPAAQEEDDWDDESEESEEDEDSEDSDEESEEEEDSEDDDSDEDSDEDEDEDSDEESEEEEESEEDSEESEDEDEESEDEDSDEESEEEAAQVISLTKSGDGFVVVGNDLPKVKKGAVKDVLTKAGFVWGSKKWSLPKAKVKGATKALLGHGISLQVVDGEGGTAAALLVKLAAARKAGDALALALQEIETLIGPKKK